MIERTLTTKILDLASKYPIVTLTGPRQSGKSTLLKNTFADYKYVSLEDTDMRDFASVDPRGFINTFPDRTIIDEVQRVPSLFSYLQTHVDSVNKEGMYMLAGSHNFLLMESINQSLAGRTAVLKLLPFSHKEMSYGGILPSSIDEEIFKGCYPRLHDKSIEPDDYYPYYIQTYVERDVRMLKNISDLSLFVKFIKLCAGRIGQMLNMASLATECGVSVPTISSWLSILEASYICYMLKPDYSNYAKRLVKTPKLYFYDTGLACSLLGIRSESQLSTHFLRGGLFENMVINEFVKKSFHVGETPELYFWRDSNGLEVDLIRYESSVPHAYEIKSGATYSLSYFDNLKKWMKLSGYDASNGNVVYGGETSLATSDGILLSWKDGI